MEDKQLFTIDESSPIPKYHQIRMNLQQLVEDEILKPGELLPSEFALAERYGVSRLTLRKAIGDLVAEGYLLRKQGVGTYVAEAKPVQIQPSPMGFSARMSKEGRIPTSRVVSIKRKRATKNISKKLEIPGGSSIVEIVRIRLVDDEPVLLETTQIAADLVPEIDKHDLRKSLYQVLEEHYGIHLSQGEQFIEPILLTEYNAELLNAKPGVPALWVETTAWNKLGKPIEMTTGVLRGDKSRYYFRIQAGTTR